MTIDIEEHAGICRWCGCTDEDGCAEGCGWANARHTLCTGCVNLDREIRRVHGRQNIADIYRTAEIESEQEAARQRRVGRRSRYARTQQSR